MVVNQKPMKVGGVSFLGHSLKNVRKIRKRKLSAFSDISVIKPHKFPVNHFRS